MYIWDGCMIQIYSIRWREYIGLFREKAAAGVEWDALCLGLSQIIENFQAVAQPYSTRPKV